MKFWQRIRSWRAPNSKAEELGVREVFYRLSTLERVFFVLLCIAACVIIMGGMFSSNVIPHYRAILNDNGSLNSGELTKSLDVTGSVVLLALLSLLLTAKWLPWISKILMIGAALLMFHGNIKNSAGIQARDRIDRNAPYSKTSTRIAYLKERIPGLQETWTNLTEHKWEALPDIAVATTELEARKTAATNECHVRGPKCAKAETDRKDQAAEVQRLIAMHMDEVQKELPKLKVELAGYGDTSKPVVVDAELETMSALYADAGAPRLASFAAKHDAMIEALTMDVKVIAFLGPAFTAIFWFFGLISASRSVADRRANKLVQAAAGEDAKIVLSQSPSTPIERMKPDSTSPEAVLEIEGKDLPAFAEKPETDAERYATAFLKADKEKPVGKKARTRKDASKDSALLYYDERMLARDGRNIHRKVLRPDYEQWCQARNLTPLSVQAFNDALREERGVEIRKIGGELHYMNMGLRPGALRVVA